MSEPFRVSIEQRRRLEYGESSVPLLFGRAARTRLLCVLAMSGPLHVRHLGRLIGSDSHKTFDMVEHFRKLGIVLKRERPGGRKYVAINKSFFGHAELMALLEALSRDLGLLPVTDVPRTRWALQSAGIESSFDRSNELFGSVSRTKTLVGIQFFENPSLSELALTSLVDYSSIKNAVNHFEREGIVVSTLDGSDRRVRINSHFSAATQLSALLERLASSVESTI